MPVSTPQSPRHLRKKRLHALPLSPIPPYRLKLVFFILCTALIGLSGRMAWLQLFRGAALEARARDYQTKRIKPLGTRYSIVDRRGRLVALDEKLFKLYAHPRQFNFPGDSNGVIRSPEEVALKIADPLMIPKANLIALLRSRDSGVKIAEGLAPEVASNVRRLGISGLELMPYPQRNYPLDNLFANVVGFLDYDRKPQAGLELSLNKKLSRQGKTHNLRHGADGTPLPSDLGPGFFSGDNKKIKLTLDARLQEVAIKAVKAQVKEWRAEKGVAIVMNVHNGELLALASTPTYNPNKYWEFSPERYKEWSIEELIEPGSTFKPINLALALQEGVIATDGTVYDSGSVEVGGYSLRNWNKKGNGLLDYPSVLQVSSNVAMVNIMQKLTPSRYWELLNQLGVSTRLDTDLPGAIAGHLKSKEIFTNTPIEPAVASFGQGFSLTPIKLAQLHALLANGGYLVKPHITKGFLQNEKLSNNNSVDKKQILSSQVTNIVLKWMETVVQKGSGKGVRINGYRIGGKTGTAEKIHDDLKKLCSFVAILPIEQPQFVVVVAIDEPKKAYAYGSTVAVPVAKEIIESLIVIEQIPPYSAEKDLISSKFKKR